MQVDTNGPWAPILMFLALAAAPLLAICGVPHIESLDADAEEEIVLLTKEEVSNPTASRRAQSSQSAQQNAPESNPAHSTNPVPTNYRAGDRPEASAPAGRDWVVDENHQAASQMSQQYASLEPTIEPSSTYDVAPRSTIPPLPSAATASVEPGIQRVSATIPTPPRREQFASSADDNPLTWQAATQRLRELGISNFQLVPGSEPSGFYFSCSYTPADNPRITRRFEAEANQPLRAVEMVLQQVEQWNAGR